MAPKKKAQKMALADFFADPTSGSWADEMDNLPTAPAARDPNAAPGRGEPGYLDSMPDRASRAAFNGPPREELPLPTVPPFTAFVGNMSFETDEEALKGFFGNSTTVRIMKDPQGTPKGFGYVEFGTQDGLKEALGKNGTQLAGRTVRVTVAEAPSSRREFTPSAADEASQWRRSGPLPARDPPPAARRQGSYSDAPAGGDRDWSAARGARFTPSVPATPSGLRRDSSGPGREREFREREPSMADDAGQWRSSRPLVDIKEGQQQQQQQGRGGFASGQTSPSLAETEQTWSRGTKLRTPVASEPAASGTASPAEERDWRSSRATSAVPSNDGDNSPRQPPAPVERRKLNLAPRSVPATPSTDPSATAESPATPSSSIFGSAKPADTASKEREAAAKLAVRDAERKKAREEEFAREAEKGKKLAEDKARSIREAQEKAQAELTGKKPQPSASASKEKEKKRPERKVGEDGFEVARGGKGGVGSTSNGAKPPVTRKESTTRTGFSFANAAGSGFAAETTGEEDDVAEVTNGVEDVKV